MTTLYPKQPFGPSAPGSAGVRALDIADAGAFQRRWTDSNTQALRQGDFRKVLTGGAEYLSSGRVSPTSVQTRQAQRYQMPFTPYIPLFPRVNMEDGQYATVERNDLPTLLEVYNYTIYPGQTAAFGAPRERDVIGVVYGSFYGGSDLRGAFNGEYRFISGGGGLGIDPLTPEFAFVANEAGVKVTSFIMLVNDGRLDAQGRPLHDILWAQFRTAAPTQSIIFDTPAFTRADAEFAPFFIQAITEDHAVAITAERFFAPGEFDAGRDYEPQFWLFVATAKSLGGISAFNVTDAVFPSNFYPAPTPAGTDPITSDPFPSHYLPNAGAFRDRKLDFTLALCRAVVLPGNRVVLMFPQLCMPQGAPRWRLRIVALDVALPAATTAVDEDIGPGTEVQAYIQSAVHLGEGWILAKRVAGFGGTNFDVQFMLSQDSGDTWTTFAPSGFTAALKNRFYGNFIVHKARTPTEPGVVLLPAWDDATSAVYVWASLDNGLTWAKRGMLAKPDAFYRVDTMLAGDGGGNFGTLFPGPDPTRPADVTLPGRYT